MEVITGKAYYDYSVCTINEKGEKEFFVDRWPTRMSERQFKLWLDDQDPRMPKRTFVSFECFGMGVWV